MAVKKTPQKPLQEDIQEPLKAKPGYVKIRLNKQIFHSDIGFVAKGTELEIKAEEVEGWMNVADEV